jgi:hypothetical protein
VYVLVAVLGYSPLLRRTDVRRNDHFPSVILNTGGVSDVLWVWVHSSGTTGGRSNLGTPAVARTTTVSSTRSCSRGAWTPAPPRPTPTVGHTHTSRPPPLPPPLPRRKFAIVSPMSVHQSVLENWCNPARPYRRGHPRTTERQ